MKTISRFFLLAGFAFSMGLCSCTDYQDEVDGLDKRVTVLENLVNRTNQNIKGVSQLLAAAEEGWVITGIVEVPAKDDPDGVGYRTITLAKIDPATGKLSTKPEDKKVITITNGKKGDDATEPNLEVRKGEDGIYYWFIDGKPLIGPDGKQVPASGKDGKDGKSTAPLLNIQDGFWVISYDSGETWEPLLDKDGNKISATGENGKDAKTLIEDATIKVDTEGNRYVIFTFYDGTTVTLPLK